MYKRFLLLLILAAVVTIGAAMGSSSGSSAGVSPLANRAGLRAGLAPVPEAQEPRARRLIGRVRVGPEGAQRLYDRRAFGNPWTDSTEAKFAHNGCDTRDDVLKRDLSKETFRPDDCVVLTGTLEHDPYTGRKIEFWKTRAQRVQIDHVVALHYAWQHGADKWSDDKRETYANDPLVLLAVDGPANIRKSDHGLSEWLPPNKVVWCALAVRQAQIVIRYKLTVTELDKHTMMDVCS